MIHWIIVYASLGAAIAAIITWPLARRKFDPNIPADLPPSADLTKWDERFMAYHEAGHAVCSYHLPERERLLRITISPSDEAFGMIRTALRPHHNETRVSFMSTLAVLLAGRIAEEMFLEETTTSCIHDLAAARQLASDMVLTWGMGSRTGVTMPPPELNYGELLRNQCDADIRELLAYAECSAHDILAKHTGEVENLAQLLLEKYTIGEQEIDDFFGSRKIG